MPFSEAELQMMEQLVARPKAREKIMAAYKEEFPEAVIPEYDSKQQIRQEFQAAFDKQQKELDEMKARLHTESRERTWKDEQEQIKKTFGWDDEKLSQFQKDFAEEFKDSKPLGMLDMAEYYELKNRPLSPAANPGIGPFGLRQEQSSTEAKWREDVQDPKSPARSKNKKERKAYWRNSWTEARKEMIARGIR